jgi:hypothetical protein
MGMFRLLAAGLLQAASIAQAPRVDGSPRPVLMNVSVSFRLQ